MRRRAVEGLVAIAMDKAWTKTAKVQEEFNRVFRSELAPMNLRKYALELAIGKSNPDANTVKRAAEFYEFLVGDVPDEQA